MAVHGLYQAPGRMVMHMKSLANDTVLQRNAVGFKPVFIPVNRKHFILSPGKGYMIKNKSFTIGDARGVVVFCGAGISAEPYSYMPYNRIAGAGKRNFSAIQDNTCSRRCLSGNCCVGCYIYIGF